MNLRFATKAIFAASIVASSSAADEAAAQKAAVRGAPEHVAKTKEKMETLSNTLRELRELWEDRERYGEADDWGYEQGWGGGYPYGDGDYDDDDYHSLIVHFIDAGKHIKSMFKGHRHQLADGLKEFKLALLNASEGEIEDHVFNHSHTASSKEAGNHTHTVNGETDNNGIHKHDIPNEDDHVHGLPNIKCETTCHYEDKYYREVTETEEAGAHNHSGMTEHAGEHNHTFDEVHTDEADAHTHDIHVADEEITLEHNTTIFDDLAAAAEVLWELIEDLKNKTHFPHKHKFKGDKKYPPVTPRPPYVPSNPYDPPYDYGDGRYGGWDTEYGDGSGEYP